MNLRHFGYGLCCPNRFQCDYCTHCYCWCGGKALLGLIWSNCPLCVVCGVLPRSCEFWWLVVMKHSCSYRNHTYRAGGPLSVLKLGTCICWNCPWQHQHHVPKADEKCNGLAKWYCCSMIICVQYNTVVILWDFHIYIGGTYRSAYPACTWVYCTVGLLLSTQLVLVLQSMSVWWIVSSKRCLQNIDSSSFATIFDNLSLSFTWKCDLASIIHQ